jgi:hypothetical protein
MAANKTQYRYYQSKINKVLVEQFEIHESIIGFDHVEFRERIRDELSYLGLELHELASKCYITTSRMNYVINTKSSQFFPEEIKSIKKILGMQ